MSELELYRWGVGLMLAAAAGTAVATGLVTAPYGRHQRGGWGPTLPARLGWVLMEAPSCLFFLALFFAGDHALEAVPLVLLGFWQLHYVHRTFVYPFRLRGRGKRMPVLIAAMGALFNVFNAYLNARWISHFGSYAPEWLSDPRFLAGAGLFLLGFAVNLQAKKKKH
ncbi:MAG: hypothetical protein KDD47_26305 [Acidobacteria bacterium]|nr:hypothetical protein [Acidobacteriota bacterium]